MRRARYTSLVAAVMGVALVAPIQPPVASATPAATTDHILTINSGSIQVFATATQTFTNTGTAFSTSLTNGTAKTWFVNNGGNLTVSRFLMTITLPNNSNISAFRRCGLNIAFTGNNVCASGSSTTLTNPTSGVSMTYTISLPGSGFYSFQIVQNKSGTMTVTTVASLLYVSGTTYNS